MNAQPDPLLMGLLAVFGLGFSTLAGVNAHRLPPHGYVALALSLAPAVAMGSALFSDPAGPIPAWRLAVALILLPFAIGYATHSRYEAYDRRAATIAWILAWCVPLPIAYWLKSSLGAL